MSINQEIVKPRDAMPSGLGSECALVIYAINLGYQINLAGCAAVQYFYFSSFYKVHQYH